MGEEVEFSGGGLRSVLRSLHAYLSMDLSKLPQDIMGYPSLMGVDIIY